MLTFESPISYGTSQQAIVRATKTREVATISKSFYLDVSIHLIYDVRLQYERALEFAADG